MCPNYWGSSPALFEGGSFGNGAAMRVAPLGAYFEGQPEKIEAQLIEVREFQSGKKKPFVAMSFGGAGIVTGLCE